MPFGASSEQRRKFPGRLPSPVGNIRQTAATQSFPNVPGAVDLSVVPECGARQDLPTPARSCKPHFITPERGCTPEKGAAPQCQKQPPPNREGGSGGSCSGFRPCSCWRLSSG